VRPREAQLAMIAIELHEQQFNGVQFVEWLLGFDDDRQTTLVLEEESRRAFILAENHYQRVSQRVAVLNPQMISQVAFIQGATFAAAALGRKPFPAGAEER
jgi:hypothetical protein